MNISDAGIEFIASWEGCELEAYQDGGGVWTIGVGHTANVSPGDVITQDEAMELLADDLEWVEETLHSLVTAPLHQPHYDALCSFVFNVGGSAFNASTLLGKLNGLDYWGASCEFDRWVYDNGVEIQGLVNRRNAEQAMFRGTYLSS